VEEGVENLICQPIGVIHTPYKEPAGMPIQPAAAQGVNGTVVVYSQYRQGLKDLEGFSHIILIYYFHLVRKYSLKVTPFMDNELRGIFATRAPARPNRIGISVVPLLKIEDVILSVQNVDMVDGTPLLDIKPYVPEFDHQIDIEIGWLKKNIEKLKTARAK
jgi:tRNA-Thr(GGU) m(6)t(6)A37 methyltransferase TsaA